MRAVVQRVRCASVEVDGAVTGSIEQGLLVLVGVGREDGEEDARWLADKLVGLRIFADDEGRFDRSVAEVGGGILLVSQFTLYGDARKGRRPSFTGALGGPEAEALFDAVCARVRERHEPVARGLFGADMQVSLINDGPVTIILESP